VPFQRRCTSFHAVLTPFQRHFNAISTPFQRHFNAISTPFQRHFNAITTPLQRVKGGVALWGLSPEDAQGASPGTFIQILCDAHSQMVIHSGWLPDPSGALVTADRGGVLPSDAIFKPLHRLIMLSGRRVDAVSLTNSLVCARACFLHANQKGCHESNVEFWFWEQ